MNIDWIRILEWIGVCRVEGSSFLSSVPGGEPSLYATVYAGLSRFYLTGEGKFPGLDLDGVLETQDSESGYFIGPELRDWAPAIGAKHDLEHILKHLCCTVLPVLDLANALPRYPLTFALPLLDRGKLVEWLERIDWKDAWLEGNNLLFALQLLIYLRDREGRDEANAALTLLFEWLDREADPKTGLWGSNGHCSVHQAMCGGYHQLLAYYYERRPVPYPQALVDATLGLQHPDGGFSPWGGGGACEEVDAVDILVNLYKSHDYRRPDIRIALRRCLRHLARIQNSDGGFPYRPGSAFSHMGIPATASGAGESNLFATWFRLHTLALIAEILPGEPVFKGRRFWFNPTLSMGWHRSWRGNKDSPGRVNRAEELLAFRMQGESAWRWVRWQRARVAAKLKSVFRMG